MNPAQRIAVENLIEYQQQKPMVGDREDGEIDFFLLSMLEQKREGWIGQLLTALMDAFSEDQQTGDTAARLEEAAAILIAWSANVRERQRQDAMAIGRRVLIRAPGHRPRFWGEIQAGGHIWVEALGRGFQLDDVRLLATAEEDMFNSVPEPSIDFQSALNRKIRQLGSE